MSEEKKQGFNVGINLGTVITTLIAGLVMTLYTDYSATRLQIPALSVSVDSLQKSIGKIEVFMHDYELRRTSLELWKQSVLVHLEKHDSAINDNRMDMETVTTQCESNEREIEKCKYSIKGMR